MTENDAPIINPPNPEGQAAFDELVAYRIQVADIQKNTPLDHGKASNIQRIQRNIRDILWDHGPRLVKAA